MDGVQWEIKEVPDDPVPKQQCVVATPGSAELWKVLHRRLSKDLTYVSDMLHQAERTAPGSAYDVLYTKLFYLTRYRSPFEVHDE